MTQSSRETARKQEFALAETLKRLRADVVKHVESGEGAPIVSRNVYWAVADVVESIDIAAERLMTDHERDEAIDESVEDIDRG
jgi:hypothetical protein